MLFAKELIATAWPAIVGGIAVHLFGMVGTMRLQAIEGYRPSSLETSAYWLCWAIIFVLLVYAAAEFFR